MVGVKKRRIVKVNWINHWEVYNTNPKPQSQVTHCSCRTSCACRQLDSTGAML